MGEEERGRAPHGGQERKHPVERVRASRMEWRSRGATIEGGNGEQPLASSPQKGVHGEETEKRPNGEVQRSESRETNSVQNDTVGRRGGVTRS